ncbi:MAG TPA: type II secretion system inner membrane protein GspF [Haliangiales bacterium]|nr:type II secretion system inner membrane protein GspF [Haliangiales bacterium]
MALWAYKGIGANGKSVTGAREADSPKMLRIMLKRDGILVTDVSEARAGKSAAAAHGKGLRREVDLGSLLGGIKKAEVATFTRQLATLLKAGIPLAESLGALFDQIDNPKLRTIVGEVRSKVNEGSSLADAMGKHPKVFEGVYVSMVRAGETAGNLDDVLVRLADFGEAQAKIRSKVTGAMIYPAIMATIATIVMIILMVAVVPKITTIYEDTERQLPWNTVLLITVSNAIGEYYYMIPILAIALGWGFRRWVRSPGGRRTWDAFVLRLPLVGKLARQIAIGRFARTFGTMLASGVPLLRALDTSKEILGNVTLEKAIEEAREQIQQGASIAVTLKKTGHFPSVVTHMIAVGERAGQLEQMLRNVADAYDAETDMKLARFTTVLEPLMIVAMGGAVAFIVFSILMPILDMNPV